MPNAPTPSPDQAAALRELQLQWDSVDPYATIGTDLYVGVTKRQTGTVYVAATFIIDTDGNCRKDRA